MNESHREYQPLPPVSDILSRRRRQHQYQLPATRLLTRHQPTTPGVPGLEEQGILMKDYNRVVSERRMLLEGSSSNSASICNWRRAFRGEGQPAREDWGKVWLT